MVGWLKKSLLSLLALLALVLALHGVALWQIGQQLRAMGSAITAQTDPLFTRQITQQTVLPSARAPTATAPTRPAPVPKYEPKRPVAQVNATQVATKSIVDKTTVEPTAALPAPTASAAASVDSVVQDAVSKLLDVTVNASDTNPLRSPQADASAASAAEGTDPAASLAAQGPWPSDTLLSYKLGGYFRGELFGNAQVQWTRLPYTQSSPAQGTPIQGTPIQGTPVQGTPTSVATPGERYQVRINLGIGPLGVQFASQGRIGITGLQPEVYEEQVPNGVRKVTLERREIVLNNGSRVPRPEDGLAAVQDTASQFVELGQRFSTGRARLAAGEVVRLWLARPGGVDEWVYDIGPPETLTLPALGAVQAYPLTPRPLDKPRGTISAQMWIAPSLQNLPVRIKITLSEQSYVDLMVQKIEQR